MWAMSMDLLYSLHRVCMDQTTALSQIVSSNWSIQGNYEISPQTFYPFSVILQCDCIVTLCSIWCIHGFPRLKYALASGHLIKFAIIDKICTFTVFRSLLCACFGIFQRSTMFMMSVDLVWLVKPEINCFEINNKTWLAVHYMSS